MKQVFDYDTILHNYNYQIPDEQLKKLRSANQEWRKILEVGDKVDAIVQEDNNRCSGWSQAVIGSINGDAMHLNFTHDTKNSDRYLDRWSVEIALFETKTKENFEWRSSLKVGSVVDSHDKTVWNKSTILQIKEELVSADRTVPMAYVAFRIYHDNGMKSDTVGKYDGWSERFDEWVSVYSPRI
jgi:hypothetical protein